MERGIVRMELTPEEAGRFHKPNSDIVVSQARNAITSEEFDEILEKYGDNIKVLDVVSSNSSFRTNASDSAFGMALRKAARMRANLPSDSEEEYEKLSEIIERVAGMWNKRNISNMRRG